uniref:DNA topoisomerase (ATP-hydrolyzing) n=1 Tax=viral metagenome TaxID=1070528 RepID=A0A6C0ABU5_9ZZZZ
MGNDDKKSKKSKSNKVTIEETYQKLTQHEHILKEPDMWIGSVHKDKIEMRVLDETTNKVVPREIEFTPGFYKIFDEIIVNALDHSVNEKTVKTIKVDIDEKEGIISVFNDGKSIPIGIHKKEKMHVPEMIFGNLLTSSHYAEKKKVTGGKNGIGSKAVNIYSTDFWIEIVDDETKQMYKQHFYDNMFKKDPPIITKSTSAPYVKITFKADFKKFDMKGLESQVVPLLKKRVYDCAGVSNKRVSVYLNGKKLNIKSFEEYINMFSQDDESESESGSVMSSKPVYEKLHDRWEVGMLYDPSAGFNQISYVNGVCTYQGGTHVNYITDKIVNAVMKMIQDKHKDLKIKPSQIKDNMTVFVKSTIEDPSFNSQVKEVLTTKVSDYGSKCELSDEFIKKVGKTGIVDSVVNMAKLKELAEMKKSDGKKRSKLKGLAKLEDATNAGTRKSDNTTLILTEGDSAKPFAMVAREVVGHDRIGVFPLKGKVLNVREATTKQLKTNEEIINIKQIMGLKQGQRYKDTKDLRYSRILVLTDADVDGTHIKGLILNLFHFFWPSLLKVDGFIQSYATPIVKAFKNGDKSGKYTKSFYTLSEYEKWCDKTDTGRYEIRYYKGLGTSTEEDSKEAFQNFDNNVINYVWSMGSEKKEDNKSKKDIIDKKQKRSEIELDSDSDSDSDRQYDNPKDECNKSINLAFSKLYRNERKKWLKTYDKDRYIENSIKKVPVSRFINDDLIHFSNYDNIRSIPSLIDGFKPSQRKTMYGCFDKKLKKAIKVSQLSGHISAVSQYHHGEVSLQGTIVNMAQNFVGSNNLNLLVPEGNFGTRIKGGKDSSSSRYIFTKLSDMCSYIFRKEDEHITKNQIEDGEKIEPTSYPVIVPTVLMNGTEGIGTGFSTNIPCFNPLDVAENLKNMIDEKEVKSMKPWYWGYTGSIKKVNDTTYESCGKWENVNETTIRITELPLKTWTLDYKNFLEECIADDPKKPTEKKFIASYTSYCTNTKVNFLVEFCKGIKQKLIKNPALSKKKETIEGKMKLTSNINISNMHLYDAKGQIKKYNTPIEILQDFYEERKTKYIERKEHWVRHLKNLMEVCYYRKKYIKMVLENKIIVMKKKEIEVIKQIEDNKFPKLNITDADAPEDKKSYDYLKRLLIFHLTQEKMEELEAEYQEKKEELEKYKKLTIEEIWKSEIDEFVSSYKKWEKETNPHNTDQDEKLKSKKKKKKNIKTL